MADAPSITVAVRIRPPTPWEISRLPDTPSFDEPTLRGDGNLSTSHRTSHSLLSHILRITDERLLVFDPPDEDTARAFKERGFHPPGTKRYKDRRFLFDRVFDMDTKQCDVFEETTKPLLGGLFDGFNATVFAYGATGCGKTHTISGSENDPGIIYLTMAELFQLIEDKKEEIKVDVSVTFLEIYNEEIRDLLTEPGSPAPKGGLVIREDKSVKVSNLTELRPVSAEEVKQIVLAGNARRTQSPTHANETSSRSHAVLQIHLMTAPRTADTTEVHRMATLSIIDLAGSERASATKNMGERMIEGANINKSLLALGNCINALCEAGGRKAHVPYRNSKLTRLLKFSLGGNCKTVMIVCVAPASNHFDDTHNTLVYAERAKKIKTKAVTANYVNVDRHVGQYVEAINRLNTEVAELKARLAGKAGVEAEVMKRKRAEMRSEVERAKGDIQGRLDEIRSSIANGAACRGELGIADANQQSIHTRLAQIRNKALQGSLTTDLTAERDLLTSLVQADELVLLPESALNARIRKSDNTFNMFEAMLRAVCERKADKLEEMAVEVIALKAEATKATAEKLKVEAETNVLRAAVGKQAELVTNLIGILVRCTTMLKDGSEAISNAAGGPDGPEATARTVAASMVQIARANDSVLHSLLGQSTSAYTSSSNISSLLSFTSHSPPPPIPANVPIPSSRRSSRGISSGQAAASPRRLRSPRKSSVMRTTANIRGVDRSKEKKSLRWKDEVGQGKLDDGSPSILVATDHNSNRNVSTGGSESEWEDEKTEDSVSLGTSISTSSGSRKRSRSTRLDPDYFKTSKESSTLSSLAGSDESPSSIASRRSKPLSDRGNQMGDGPGNSYSVELPKGRTVSGTPRIPSSASRAGRRRSQVGPIRSEKTSRRRSSLIPQPSPPNSKPILGGARRIPLDRSPAKRTKRASLLGAPRMLGSVRILKSGTTSALPSSSVIFDQNVNTCGVRPTWR